MNLELIKSFAVLGQVCHFGEASRRLGISQPSLTKQIQRLEYLLGSPLFERGRQGTVLTAFGRKFLEDIQPLLRQADQVWDEGLRAARGERGRLRIGFTFSSVEVMSRVLLQFKARYPEVELSFEDISSRHQLQRLREGTLDAGFVRLPVAPGLCSHKVAEDRLVFVSPREGAASLSGFDDPRVAERDFLGLQPTMAPGLEERIQALFHLRHFQPRSMHRVNESLTLLTLVAAGFGVALMHESALRPVMGFAEAVHLRPVTDPLAAWSVGLVWREDDPNPVVRHYLDLARAVLDDSGGR